MAVARAVDLDDGARLGAVGRRLLGDRLVAMRIEPLALRRVGLDADARERGEQLGLDEADPVGEVVVAVLGLGLGGRQRALEVVERGQKLTREPRDAARLGDVDVALGALAHVVELGRRPQPLVLVVGLLWRRLGLDGLGLGGLGLHGLRLLGNGLAHRLVDGGRLTVLDVLLGAHDLPSSTTSASTTSSSTSGSAVAPSAGAPLPWAAEACCCARSYMASETLWKELCSASVLALISLASSEVSASRTALIAASIS